MWIIAGRVLVAVELAGRDWKIGAVRALLHYQLCLDDKPLFSNATGYVVQEAYKLDFINDMAESIGLILSILVYTFFSKNVRPHAASCSEA